MEQSKKPRFKSHVMKQLIRVNQNLYLNPADPRYHEKVIEYMDRSCPISHYNLGMESEKVERWSEAQYHYQEATRKHSSHYYEAKQALKRIEHKIKKTETDDERDALESPILMLYQSIIIILFLFAVVLVFFLFNYKFT